LELDKIESTFKLYCK